MPSSATITAFYSFTANTKARASQVNNNFDVFRGHLLPVHVSTQTSANNTYDLGSDDYSWRTAYVNTLNIDSNTTTGQALTVVGDTNAGNGAFLVKRDTHIHARIGGGTQYINGDTTTSQIDFRLNGTTIGSIKSDGYNGDVVGKFVGSYGDRMQVSFGFNTGTLSTTTASAVNISGSTATIVCSGTRPVFVGFMQKNSASPSYLYTSKSTNGAELNNVSADIYRNATVIGQFYPELDAFMTALGFGIKELTAPMNFWMLDFPSAGTTTYSAKLQFNISSSFISGLANGKLVAFEF